MPAVGDESRRLSALRLLDEARDRVGARRVVGSGAPISM